MVSRAAVSREAAGGMRIEGFAISPISRAIPVQTLWVRGMPSQPLKPALSAYPQVYFAKTVLLYEGCLSKSNACRPNGGPLCRKSASFWQARPRCSLPPYAWCACSSSAGFAAFSVSWTAPVRLMSDA